MQGIHLLLLLLVTLAKLMQYCIQVLCIMLSVLLVVLEY
jgi:hypothetical protein